MAQDRLVIFDCDGVLVDSEPLSALAYERVYARHGMPIAADIFGSCIGMKQADIIEKIHVLSGHRLPDHALAGLWDETKVLFGEQLRSTRGLPAFLTSLQTTRCVASSSSLERIRFSLAVTGLADGFGDAIFSSSMVRRGKPAPDIFLFAAERMGFAPDRCVVIEDSRYGVQGAVAAGMTAIGYVGGSHTHERHGSELAAAGATAICATWDEVATALRSLWTSLHPLSEERCG